MADAPGEVRRQLEFLINGFDFYGRAERLRADDLLVRERAATSLVAAVAALRDAGLNYRRNALPPPTREHPDPDPAALALAREIDRVAGRAGDVEALVRGAPFAHGDRAWARLRGEKALLELLLEHDLLLVRCADAVAQAARGLRFDTASGAGALGPVTAALDEVETAFRARQAELMHPL